MNEKIDLIIPLSLVEYLSHERKFTNRNKFTRTRAFYDLIYRCLQARQNNEDMAVNISELSKSWLWSMPSVSKFVDMLCKFNIASVEKMINNKIVIIKSEVIKKTLINENNSLKDKT